MDKVRVGTLLKGHGCRQSSFKQFSFFLNRIFLFQRHDNVKASTPSAGLRRPPTPQLEASSSPVHKRSLPGTYLLRPVLQIFPKCYGGLRWPCLFLCFRHKNAVCAISLQSAQCPIFSQGTVQPATFTQTKQRISVTVTICIPIYKVVINDTSVGRGGAK